MAAISLSSPSPILALARSRHRPGLNSSNNFASCSVIARCAIAIVILLALRPAAAESLNADAARRFVVGKLFAFSCFDGSRGAGRIYGDGSVVGTIQLQGVGPVESV